MDALPVEAQAGRQTTGWFQPGVNQPARALAVYPCLLNVLHSRLTGPEDGFGQKWEKIYYLRLPAGRLTPEGVIAHWKERFSSLWPRGSQFFTPAAGIRMGEIALLKLSFPGRYTPFVATGVYINHADSTRFTYTALSGHPIAGSLTFTAFREDGDLIVQAHAVLRASDPLYEIAFRLAGEREDLFWQHTLENLAASMGVPGHFSKEIILLDPGLRWRNARNLLHNAAIRSAIYQLTFPMRLLRLYWIGKRYSR